jgi:hypothetical protein
MRISNGVVTVPSKDLVSSFSGCSCRELRGLTVRAHIHFSADAVKACCRRPRRNADLLQFQIGTSLMMASPSIAVTFR